MCTSPATAARSRSSRARRRSTLTSRSRRSDAAVDAFHEDVVGAGYRDNGAPGERAHYHSGYYGAFVLDPDGNNIELVNHNR
jgi:predicted lactoylglutathione lyase